MATLITEDVVAIPDESQTSAVSWGAIAAGGVAAAGFSLFLFQLGTGIGLSVTNPWANSPPSGTTISVAVGISLCLISIAASALGGLLAGRLRTRWVGLHSDETYFRDSAHGFLAWAFATVLIALVVGITATSLVGGAAKGAASNPALVPDTSYYTDMLFRSDNPTAPPASPGAQQSNEEVGRIVTRSLTGGSVLSPADRTYVAQRVAARTGLPQDQAERRVDQVITQAKNAADEARKAGAKLAFWMAGAMLAGALAAAFAAAEGGRERDD
ncbi:MAG: hypothetical protein WCE79_15215 [Xanthobacteraceae bacterium]